MFRHISTPLLFLVAMILLSACAATSPPAEEMELPVFPPPPNEPRFLYERSLISSADVEFESEESQFRRWVTGARRSGIGMGKPFGITVHQGRVFVSDTLKRLVLVFDIREGRFFEIGTDGPGDTGEPIVPVSRPQDIQISDTTDSVTSIRATTRRTVVPSADRTTNTRQTWSHLAMESAVAGIESRMPVTA